MSDVLTGARVRLQLEGQTVGTVTGLTVDEEVEFQPLEVLDEIHVHEHVSVAYRVRGTATRARLYRGTPTRFGFGFDLEELKRGGIGLTGMVIDSVTSKSVGRLNDFKMEARSQNIEARAIVMENIRWVAILFLDEDQQNAQVTT